MSRPQSIVLGGYLGFDNCGDEAMLAAAIGWLRRQLPDVRLTVLSHHPEATARLHGVPSLPALPQAPHQWPKILLRPGRWASLRALSRADLAIWITGSGIFSDAQGHTIGRFLPLYRLMRRLAGRFLFLSASVGPIDFPQSERVIARIMEDCDALCTRDGRSREKLIQILGSDRPGIVPMSDIAFELDPAPPDVVDARWRAEGLNADADHVAFCPLYFFQNERRVPRWREYEDQFTGAVAGALDVLHETHGLQPVFIPFQRHWDERISRRIAGRMKTPANVLGAAIPPAEILGLIGRMRLVIATRLHAAILSARAATPFVTIVYDDKGWGFCEDLGMSALSMDYLYWRPERPALDGRRLVRLAGEALWNEEGLRRRLRERTDRMRELNQQAAGTLRALGIF